MENILKTVKFTVHSPVVISAMLGVQTNLTQKTTQGQIQLNLKAARRRRVYARVRRLMER